MVSPRDSETQALGYRKTAAAGETIAFGTYPFSREINHPRLALSFTDTGGITHYKRRIGTSTFEADIATKNHEYTIMPLPPMMQPKRVTDFLQIKFNEISLEPGSTTVIFVTAPLEIGVSLTAENGTRKILDTLSFAHPKFALYGTATRGIVTRFVTSNVTTEPLPIKNYREFQLRLKIENTADTWVSLARVILYMNDLVFYYDDTAVAACASVRIINNKTATVLCSDYPLRENMTRVEPVVPERKFMRFCNVKNIIESNAVIMDMGLI
ncbi:MAG TPA: DUF432 domain-containing protein [Methanocorpusculum sp.]|nr:DUF432 domain-containing protein [Methanocorpusculum sp.]